LTLKVVGKAFLGTATEQLGSPVKPCVFSDNKRVTDKTLCSWNDALDGSCTENLRFGQTTSFPPNFNNKTTSVARTQMMIIQADLITSCKE
jgi:hypothetical protein